MFGGNMSEQNESEQTAPPIISPAEAVESEHPELKPFSYWARRFLVCNPFYLVSAALLLFGMYRLSVDPRLFGSEISQLVFNLSSLEFYEILLVATAIFLAARRIWYDSTLLVGLENLFVFVPFILLSQVALISTHVIWSVCATATIIAVLRFNALKRHFAELNLPAGLLWIGATLMAINIGWIALYRMVGEHKMGWVPDSGPDFVKNQITWLVILPAALALANFLPHARENGSFEPQRRWLPAGFFTLWIMATGAHLYCLNYVYLFAFNFGMLVPALWMLAWTAYRRGPEIFQWQTSTPQYALALASLLVPIAAASESGTKIFFTLTALNAGIYAVMWLREREGHFARHLLFASLVLLVCGLPNEWLVIHSSIGHWGIILHREMLIQLGIAAYLMLYIVMSRNPKAGIFGAVLTAMMTGVAFSDHGVTFHSALQSGLVFLLLHSLGWDDSEHEGARVVRNVATAVWASHAFVWAHVDAALWMPCLAGGIVLAAYLITQFLRGRWDTVTLPAASILTILSGPGNFLIDRLHSAPSGLLAVVGSFVLFALGTAAALTKHRWQRNSIERETL
jgi:hypothetical protein